MIGLDDKDYIIKLEAEVERLQEQLSSLGRNFDLQEKEVERLRKAATDVVDGAALVFSDPRVSYEEWQLEPGVIDAMCAALRREEEK